MHCTAIGKALLATADRDVRREVLMSPLGRRTPHTIGAAGVLQRQLRKVLEAGVAYENEESSLALCASLPRFSRRTDVRRSPRSPSEDRLVDFGRWRTRWPCERPRRRWERPCSAAIRERADGAQPGY
jgi:hypothetical protein